MAGNKGGRRNGWQAIKGINKKRGTGWQVIKGMNKKSCSAFANSQCIALIAVVLLVSLIGLFTGKVQVSGINSRTKYGSSVPILGDSKMQERRQAETGGPMAA